jgi:hypothetical protein
VFCSRLSVVTLVYSALEANALQAPAGEMWTLSWTVTGLVVSSALAHQIPFSRASCQDGRVLPALHASIAEILKNNTVPGYSIAVVRLDTEHELEYDAWGVSTEDGEKMTPEVGTYVFLVVPGECAN